MQLARREAEAPDLQVAVVEPPTIPAGLGLEAMSFDIYRRIHDCVMDHAERFLSRSEAEDADAGAVGEIWQRWTKLRPEQRSDAYFLDPHHSR